MRSTKAIHSAKAYAAELEYLLFNGRSTLMQLAPSTLTRDTARVFAVHLNAIRSCGDDAVMPLLDEMVEAVCGNPAVARKGVTEIISSAGYLWLKPYIFK